MKKLTLLLLFISNFTFAQQPLITETLAEIDFEQDTIKSVFDWITDNIKYDVKLMNNHMDMVRSKSKDKSKFDSREEYLEDLVVNVIKKKKAVCEGYSYLFHELVTELGYESAVVLGYTKNERGNVQRKIGHAWNAIKVKGEWKLYDATWGAGSVKDGKKFIKDYKIQWFDASPEEMIKNHMPYDPVWQLQEYPISFSDFDENIPSENTTIKYDCKELLKKDFSSEKKVVMANQLKRSKEMGEAIRLVEKWRDGLEKSIDFYDLSKQPEIFNNINTKMNAATNNFNDYINAKNKQFKKKKWTTEYCTQLLTDSKVDVISVIETFNSIDVVDKSLNRKINKSVKGAEKLLDRLDRELEYLKGRK